MDGVLYWAAVGKEMVFWFFIMFPPLDDLAWCVGVVVAFVGVWLLSSIFCQAYIDNGFDVGGSVA